jgi:hypothetical protein
MQRLEEQDFEDLFVGEKPAKVVRVLQIFQDFRPMQSLLFVVPKLRQVLASIK